MLFAFVACLMWCLLFALFDVIVVCVSLSAFLRLLFVFVCIVWFWMCSLLFVSLFVCIVCVCSVFVVVVCSFVLCFFCVIVYWCGVV